MKRPRDLAPRALAATLFLLAACNTGDRTSPGLSSIAPSRTLEGASVAVTIRGELLTGRAYTDFETASGSHLDASFTARLGPAALRAVQLTADGVLTATVPEGLAAGTYDLAVVDPWGHEATLPGAFRVVSLSELDQLVAGYRIDSVGAQRAFAPFSVTVAAVDSQGEVVPYFNGALQLSDSTGTAVPAQVGAFALGRWTGLVEVRKASAADVLTVSDASGRTGQSAAFAVTGGDPAQLRFSTAAQQVLAGACSDKVELQLLDASGFEATAQAAVALAVAASPAADFTLYADSGCTTPLGALGILTGGSTTGFFFRALRAGVVELDASASGLPGDSQLEDVGAAAAERLVFATAAQTLVAGQCSARVRVESQDAQGNAAPVFAQTAVALASSPQGLHFFQDAACATPLSALSLDAGSSSASLYFSSTRTGAYALSAQTDLLGQPTQAEAILPAAPDHLAFTTDSQTLIAGQCSAGAGLELRDRFENVSPAPAAATLRLSASPSAQFAFFLSAGCGDPASSVDLAAGASAASFFFRADVEGDYTASASLPDLGAVSQVEHVKPPLADHLAFLDPARQFVAGTCSGVLTVESRDLNGVPRAPATDQVIALSADPSGVLSYFSDSACKVPVAQVALPAGQLRASFFTSGTLAGEHLAVASIAGWTSGTQTEKITPGVGDRLGFLNAPLQISAGECSPKVTVAVEDKYANPSPISSSVTVSLTAAPPDGFQLYLDDACTLALTSLPIIVGNASSDFYFRGTRAMDVVVFAASGGLKSAQQSETIRAKVPERLTFMTPARTLAAGTCTDIITVQAQDSLGNPVAVDAATAVSLTSTAPADLAFYADGSCAIRLSSPGFAAGADSLSFYIRATTAGAFTTTLQAFSAAASQAVTVNPGPTAKLSWGPVPSPELGGVPFHVVLRASDGFDNPTPAFAGSASILLAPHGSATCVQGCGSATATSAFASGVWSGAVRVDTPGTGLELVAVAGPISSPSTSFDVLAPPAQSPPLAKLTATPGAVLQGGSSLLDASGSLDYQTLTASLEASFDFSGAATSTPPWTPFAGLSASQTFSDSGVLYPRAAVRDADGELGYASAPVAAVASADDLCTVTTASLDDDGATSCSGDLGPDGKLSLAEALRLANAASTPKTLTFAGPMTIAGAGPLTSSASVTVVGSAGVVLQVPLEVGADAFLGALSFDGASLTVLATGNLTGFGLSFANGAGITVRGSASLSHLSMEACPGACIADEGSSALSVRFASMRSSASAAGIDFRTCATSPLAAQVQSAVFQGLLAGVRDGCGRAVEVRHATFEANAKGMVLSTAPSNVLEDSIFSNQSGAAIDCGTAGFSSRQRQLLWANASDGCLTGDAGNLAGDPLYTFPEAGDLRLLVGSPAIDAAPDLGLTVNADAPGPFLGSGPDLGGMESH